MKERKYTLPPKRRILSAFLALAMLLTLLPVTAFAADQYRTIDDVQYVKMDGAIIWRVKSYSGSKSDLTLESKIDGANIQIIDRGAFKGNTTLTHVRLPQGLFMDIYDEAFAGCTNLASLDIPVTLSAIGQKAFQNCTSLKTFTLGGETEEDILNWGKVAVSAFEGCSKLESFAMNAISGYFQDYAFRNCTALKEVTIPKNIKEFGTGVFDGCTSLTTIYYLGKITDWETCPAKDQVPTSVKVKCVDSIEEYNLSVRGTTVNEINYSDVLGDRTVEFKPETSSLVLSNANLSYNDASTAAIDSTLDKLTIAGNGDDTIENTSGPAIKTTGKLYLDSSHMVLKGTPAISAESITIDAYDCWYRTAADEPYVYVEYAELVSIGDANYFEIIQSRDNPNETGITLWIDGKRMPEEERYDVFGDGTVLLEEYGVHGEMHCTLNLKNANWESADTAILTRVDQLTISGTGTIKGGNNSIRTENTGTVYGAGVSIDEANLTFTGGWDLDAGVSITNSTVKINGWTDYGIKAGYILSIDGSDVTIASETGEYALCPQIVQMYGNSTLRLQGATSIANGGDQRCIILADNYWYRTAPNGEYTEGTDEIFELDPSYTYYELTTIDPYAVEKYDLWVAGTQVTETNQNDVLDDGTVAYDPVSNKLTLSNANLTLNGAANVEGCIDSQLTKELTITGTATLSNAAGIMTEGPLTLNNADLTLTGNNEYGGEDAIRAGSSDKDISIQNSKVTIAGANSEGNFFQFGIRCGNLIVANSTLDVKANSSAIAADTMEASGANTVVMAETDSSDEEEFYALALDDETPLTLHDGLALVAGKVNESKTAKIAQPEQIPDPTGYAAYWVVRPGDERVQSMQIPSAIVANEEEAHLFAGWFLEDDVTRLEDSPYYLGPGANHVGNLDRDVTFYGRWCTPDQLRTLTFEDCTVEVNGGLDMGYKADTSPVQLAPGSRVTLTLDESKVTEGMVFNGFVIDPIPADLTVSGHTATFTMPDADTTVTVNLRTESEGGSDDFGTILAGGAVVGVAGVVAYEVGTELILDQLLPADVAVPRTRAELALLLWNTAGRPAPASQPAFADVADPDLASAAQWAIEQGYLNARSDGTFKPEKHVAKWRVIRGYKAVTAQ